MTRNEYRVVTVYSDEYMNMGRIMGFNHGTNWSVYNTYRTRSGARGQATWAINEQRTVSPEDRRYKAVRVEQWDADNGNWEVLDERSIG